MKFLTPILITAMLILPLSGQDKLIKDIRCSPNKIKTGVSATFEPDMDSRYYREFTVMYHFYRNGTHVQESSAGTFFSSNYKKGDRIHAEIHLLNPNNGVLVEKAVSKKMLVNNTPPHIIRLNLPEILAPGKVIFKIEATDLDKDQLTFSIEGNKAPDYITINKDTGEVTMNMPDKFPPSIEFTIKVEDTSSGSVTRDIKFTRQKKEINSNENS